MGAAFFISRLAARKDVLFENLDCACVSQHKFWDRDVGEEVVEDAPMVGRLIVMCAVLRILISWSLVCSFVINKQLAGDGRATW